VTRRDSTKALIDRKWKLRYAECAADRRQEAPVPAGDSGRCLYVPILYPITQFAGRENDPHFFMQKAGKALALPANLQ